MANKCFWLLKTVNWLIMVKGKLRSNRTAKKMMRYGLRIIREVGRQKRTFSNLSAERFAMWYMHP